MILRSQDECVEIVKQRIYKLSSALRRIWKPIWIHLYEAVK
jgi:hypothetical protein